MTYQQYLDQLQAAGSKSRRADILRLASRDPDLSGAEFVDLVHMVYPKSKPQQHETVTKEDLHMAYIVRRLDDLGRVVIPMEMRRQLGWAPGAPLDIVPTENGVLVRMSDAGQPADHARRLRALMMDTGADPDLLELADELVSRLEVGSCNETS